MEIYKKEKGVFYKGGQSGAKVFGVDIGETGTEASKKKKEEEISKAGLKTRGIIESFYHRRS